MQTYFVRIQCDVTATVHEHPFRYRVYVNNELFTERTWIWTDAYLQENLQIQAPLGVYPIRFETVDANHGQIKVMNFKTDVEIMHQEIQNLKLELTKLDKNNLDNHGIESLEQQIQDIENLLKICQQERTVQIITYQDETALEISNAC